MRQCLGAQHEAGQEIFMPDDRVCDFLKAKTKALYDIYERYGVETQARKILTNQRDMDSRIINRISVFIDVFSALKIHMEGAK